MDISTRVFLFFFFGGGVSLFLFFFLFLFFLFLCGLWLFLWVFLGLGGLGGVFFWFFSCFVLVGVFVVWVDLPLTIPVEYKKIGHADPSLFLPFFVIPPVLVRT